MAKNAGTPLSTPGQKIHAARAEQNSGAEQGLGAIRHILQLDQRIQQDGRQLFGRVFRHGGERGGTFGENGG
ncbi:MAG: hypothetical protein OEV91_00945 [Desulfobulbaceae bacterium]|nr:hypothetical protein [Desulfobulbaceae bacterium]